MYLLNDSECHRPMTLICESEKPCKCAWVAAPILKLCALNVLESSLENFSADLKTSQNSVREMGRPDL